MLHGWKSESWKNKSQRRGKEKVLKKKENELKLKEKKLKKKGKLKLWIKELKRIRNELKLKESESKWNYVQAIAVLYLVLVLKTDVSDFDCRWKNWNLTNIVLEQALKKYCNFIKHYFNKSSLYRHAKITFKKINVRWTCNWF